MRYMYSGSGRTGLRTVRYDTIQRLWVEQIKIYNAFDRDAAQTKATQESSRCLVEMMYEVTGQVARLLNPTLSTGARRPRFDIKEF